MAGDFREAVSEALDELASPESFKRLLQDILSTDRLTSAVCPHCEQRVQLRTPDYRGYMAALAAFDGIGKGRQKQPEPPEIDDEKFDQALQRALAKLTDEELDDLERHFAQR